MLGYGKKSYSEWASVLASEIGTTVSKQAIFKRMNQSWVCLLKQLVEKVLQNQLAQSKPNSKKCTLFKNIYLQDSTTLALPDFMNILFPGNYSRGKKKAVAKINTIVNVKTGLCSSFSIENYTTAEQNLSKKILNIARKGDLVIRDLGYYVLNIFKKMNNNGIFYISRQRFNVSIFDAETGETLSMKKLLKNKSYIDINVLCGKKEKLPVRFIALKLSSKEASIKVRKARKDRDKRLNHSKEYYFLLGYIIFITNIDITICNHQQIAEFYKLRWQIEILFKSWKSGIKIEKLLPQAQCKPERIESVIYMMMLYIAWYQMKIVEPLQLESLKKGQYNISPLKLNCFILMNLKYFMINNLDKTKMKEIEYYCAYEKRQRINIEERWRDLFNQFS